MPNCVVKGCKNQSSKHKKRDGITFHTFPDRDQIIKQKWIAVIRQSRKELSWQPTSRSVVCSAHFKIEDFYYTNKGFRRVVKNRYPKILPNVIEGLDNEVISQPPNVKEEPAALDLSNDSSLSQSSTSCAVQTATASDLSVLDLNQPSTSYAVQIIASSPDLSVLDLNQPSTSSAVQPDSSIFDTPRKEKLRKRVIMLKTKLEKSKRKIKTLNQKVRRLHERNKSLREKLHNLKKNRR